MEIDVRQYTELKAALAWDTIYEPQKDRVVSTVSRKLKMLYKKFGDRCMNAYADDVMALGALGIISEPLKGRMKVLE